MPMIVIINVIDNLDSDSERDALSARMGKLLREMIDAESGARDAGDTALWEALRQEIQARKDADAEEKTARENADTDIWTKLGDLWFQDIHGKLSGTRVYALEGNEGP